MSVVGLLILQITMLRSANGQFGGGGGGPSTFGYDGSSACSKPYSRNARARFEKLPCDLRRQNWCTVAGSAYPWHAVRRFVQENQGLMRRMYGDERHINVLKAELEKNDIELEYEDRYQRYMDDESRRFQYEDEYDYANNIGKRSKSLDEDIDEGRSYTSSRLNEPTNEEVPTSTTVPSSGSPPFLESSKNRDRQETTTSTTTPRPTTISRSTSLTSSSEKIEAKVNANNSSSFAIVEKNATEPNTSSVTLADLATIKNSSMNEIPGQSELTKNEEALFGGSTVAEDYSTVENASTEPVTITQTTITSSPSSSTSSTSSTPSSIDRIDEEDDFKDSPPSSNDQNFGASEQQEFRPRPEYRPSEDNKTPANKPHLEGQLFQDVAAKDQQEQPVLKLRGVNACPVKEEVVAPFWANNTRGEVLALLNLYPFEQYVHWEKCTHENKQMYCRDGCRCEQQYRLHRLLAYDPSNECRGIFSDWFKFPSCCVCRCYDLPVEFRVTSRSPRIVHKQKVRLRPPGQGRG